MFRGEAQCVYVCGELHPHDDITLFGEIKTWLMSYAHKLPISIPRQYFWVYDTLLTINGQHHK